jgi:Tol biopolymer transport system component
VGPETVAPGMPFFLDLETRERAPLPENVAGGEPYTPSPDGTRVAYTTCCPTEGVKAVANIDGTDVRTLVAPEGLRYTGPWWSPDGSKLLYQLRGAGNDLGNLFVHDLSSDRRTQLTDLELSDAYW